MSGTCNARISRMSYSLTHTPSTASSPPYPGGHVARIELAARASTCRSAAVVTSRLTAHHPALMRRAVTRRAPPRQTIDASRKVLMKHTRVRRITAPKTNLYPRVLRVASRSPLVAVPRASERRAMRALWAVVLVAADDEAAGSTVLDSARIRCHG